VAAEELLRMSSDNRRKPGAEFITNWKEDWRVCVSPVYSELQ